MKKLLLYSLLLGLFLGCNPTAPIKFNATLEPVIIADGKTDNSPAFKILCAKGGRIILPLFGTIIITEPIQIGDMFITAKQAASYMPAFNDLYNTTRFKKACSIQGSGFVTLQKNFKDTTLPAIYISAQARNEEYKRSSVVGLNIKGKGPGIVVAWVGGTVLKEITFDGLTDGVILNNAGGFEMTNLTFNKCTRAAYIIQSACGTITNTSIAQCKLGFEIRTSQLVFNNYVSEYSDIGLWVADGNNFFNSVYLENNKPGNTSVQLIIGYSLGVDKVDGNIFNCLVITAPSYLSKAVIFRKNAGMMEFHGGGIQVGAYKIDSLSKPKIIATSFLGVNNIPKSIL